jgi:hypothetical protein
MPKSVDQSKKEKQSPKAFAKGGRDNQMFGKQQANPKKPGMTGKVDARGPGAKSAEGGPKIMSKNVGGLARPARPGCTGA